MRRTLYRCMHCIMQIKHQYLILDSIDDSNRNAMIKALTFMKNAKHLLNTSDMLKYLLMLSMAEINFVNKTCKNKALTL